MSSSSRTTTPYGLPSKRGLGLHGFDVESSAPTPRQRSPRSRRGPPACSLPLDVGLPGMSGIDLCPRLLRDRVRSLPPDPDPVARDQVGDRVAGLQAGADDYLVKPFALDELVARGDDSVLLLANADGRERARRRRATCADLCRLTSNAGSRSLTPTRLELSRREFDLLADVRRQSPHRARPGSGCSSWCGATTSTSTPTSSTCSSATCAASWRRPARPDLINTVRGVGFVLASGADAPGHLHRLALRRRLDHAADGRCAFRGQFAGLRQHRVDAQLEHRAETALSLRPLPTGSPDSELPPALEGARVERDGQTISRASCPPIRCRRARSRAGRRCQPTGERWRLHTLEVDDVPNVGDHVWWTRVPRSCGYVDALAAHLRRRAIMLGLLASVCGRARSVPHSARSWRDRS